MKAVQVQKSRARETSRELMVTLDTSLTFETEAGTVSWEGTWEMSGLLTPCKRNQLTQLTIHNRITISVA